MSVLSRLNKPIFPSNSNRSYTSSKRPIREDDVVKLKAEIELLKANNQINWKLPITYLPSLAFALLSYYFIKSILVSITSSILFFAISKVLPNLLKGDTFFLKKDILGGEVHIKSGPISVVEDNYNNISVKRIYLDDVIIDGTYTHSDILKYPRLIDGQNVEVEYSPNAQYIFKVKTD